MSEQGERSCCALCDGSLPPCKPFLRGQQAPCPEGTRQIDQTGPSYSFCSEQGAGWEQKMGPSPQKEMSSMDRQPWNLEDAHTKGDAKIKIKRATSEVHFLTLPCPVLGAQFASCGPTSILCLPTITLVGSWPPPMSLSTPFQQEPGLPAPRTVPGRETLTKCLLNDGLIHYSASFCKERYWCLERKKRREGGKKSSFLDYPQARKHLRHLTFISSFPSKNPRELGSAALQTCH